MPKIMQGGDCTLRKPDLRRTFLSTINVSHTSARAFLSVGNMCLAKVFLIFEHQGAPAKALCTLILPVHCAHTQTELLPLFLRQCDLHTKLARVAIWMDTPAAALMAASAWLLSKHQIPINTRNVYWKTDVYIETYIYVCIYLFIHLFYVCIYYLFIYLRNYI